ncbi:hypothetical protein [Sulfuriroseicoccus oceanibius]|uniref:Uncharacterized protein n=1 Tax=Sulfuriroseicoccus oceanibius TaxID=2707525 RepID=A0A6B3L8P0_9BACT|nr:hypothetical protein [Sulfuriroseicoccus oceanibius]QQL44209.1 hypothetical protein G3M56_009915 [Sulfuriroseicoccus oceanibius]
MINYPKQISKSDQERLRAAPVLIFLLLVAPSGQEAAERQKQAFSAVLRGADQVPSPLFAAALSDAAEHYEMIRAAFAGRVLDPSVELLVVCGVLKRLPVTSDEVEEYRQGLVFLADAVARAGARRSWFGRRVSRENRELLALLRGMLAA